MSKPSKPKKHGAGTAASDGRRLLRRGAIVLAVAAVVGLNIWLNEPENATPEDNHRPVETNAAPVAAGSGAAKTKPAFQPLLGRWQRPDGGYVIEIKSADDSGKLAAAYFNPNPIHMARAEAEQEGAAVDVFIELRDANYPGSTYTLAYDPANDQLKGIYFQAVAREKYEIYFERLK